jgi:hypothetical protein
MDAQKERPEGIGKQQEKIYYPQAVRVLVQKLIKNGFPPGNLFFFCAAISSAAYLFRQVLSMRV